MTIGLCLREARKNAELSVDAIAEKLDVSSAAYRRYERDEVSPQASIILRLVEMQVGQGQTLSITINATVTPSTIDEQK